MADDIEFIIHFMRLGLSEKEAQLYLHLRRYGPESLSVLATLENHEEDIYRTLNGLIDKGLVTPSFESPTVYAAVELDVALDSMITKHEMELREMVWKKEELQELSKEQQFSPCDELSTFKIITSVKEIIAAAMPLVASTEKEWLMVVPPITLVLSSVYGVIESSKKLIKRGGKVKTITDISYPYIESAQQHLDVGIDLRHFDQYRGITFAVFDRKNSISAISADISRVSLNEPLSALWINDPTCADYLISTFELLWKQSVPAAQRIEELLKEGPSNI